eukprot:scaffold473_cov132-Cylindrotheca_fusiformis.AAC.1
MEKRITYVDSVVHSKNKAPVAPGNNVTQAERLMTPDPSSTMAKPTKAAPPKAPPDRSNDASLWKGLVRVEGQFANQVKNRIETSKFTQEVYESIKMNVDSDFRMGDKDGNMFSMDGIPETYAGFTERFNLKVIDKGTHQHLMMVMMFESTKTFGALKSGCFKVLKRHNLYLHPHPFPAEKIDVGSAGFILGANARLHSPQEQKARIRNVIFQWWMDQPIEVVAQWKERFQSDKEGTDIIPDFFVNAKVAKGRDVFGREAAAAGAFLVMTPTRHIKAFSDLLEVIFKPGENTTRIEHNVQFVPSRLQFTSSALYTNLVKQQQLYLQNYGSVSIAGLCKERMYRPVTTKDPVSGREHTLPVHTILMSHPHVYRIDPAGSLATLGKWNVETTKGHLEEVKAHIDRVIEQLPVDVKEGTGFKYFPNVTRMKAARQPTEEDNKYSTWVKLPSNTEEASVLTPGTGASSRRGYSDNPQEPSIPNLLHFPSVQDSYGRPQGQTYAQTVSNSSPPHIATGKYGHPVTPSSTQYNTGTNTQGNMIKADDTQEEEKVEDNKEYITRLLQSGFDEVSGYLNYKITTELEEIKKSIQPLTKQRSKKKKAKNDTNAQDGDSQMEDDTTVEEADADVDPSLKTLLIAFMEDSKTKTAELQAGLDSLGRKQGRLNRGVSTVVERMNKVQEDMDQLGQNQGMMAESYQILHDRLSHLEAAFSTQQGQGDEQHTPRKRSLPNPDKEEIEDSMEEMGHGDNEGYATANESSREDFLERVGATVQSPHQDAMSTASEKNSK